VFISEAAKGHLEVIKSLSYVELIILIDEETVKDTKQISLKSFVSTYGSNDLDVLKLVQQPIKIFDQSAVIFMSSGTTGLPKGEKFIYFFYHVVLTFNYLIQALSSHKATK
jgi:acyl-CoA synthetase (AMP-forming)/AMP-acid ligase II